MKTRLMRPYQRELIMKMLAVPVLGVRRKKRIGVAYPQGSGKTLMLLCYCALIFGRKFHHIIVAAPQGQIVDGWHREAKEGPVQIGKMILELSGLTGEKADTEQLQNYIETHKPSQIAVTTHAAMTWAKPGETRTVNIDKRAYKQPVILDILPEDLTGFLFVVDEAHRNRAPLFGYVYDRWLERGGFCVDTTATPFRTDGKIVMKDDDESVTFPRSYALHACEGHAPDNIMTEIIPVPTKDLDKNQWIDAMCSSVVRQWDRDGRPKATVHIPVTGMSVEDDNEEEALLHRAILSRLNLMFVEAGARVYDAFNTTGEAFAAMLSAERDCKFSDSKYDIVLAVKRMDEGTDWPLCAAVYFINMPTAQWLIEQVFGRATRFKRKIEGYPPEWLDKVRVAFFMASNDPMGLVSKHSVETFVSCCMLADHKVGRRITCLRQIKEGLERALGHHRSHSRILSALDEEVCRIPPYVQAAVEGAIIATKSTDVDTISSFLAGSKLEKYRTVPVELIESWLAIRSPNSAARIAEKLAAAQERQLNPSRLPAEIRSIFEQEARAFGEKHINVELDEVSKGILHSVAFFNTRETTEPVAKIAAALGFDDPPIGDEALRRHIREFFVARHRYPKPNEGLIVPGLLWLDAAAAVRDGTRGITQCTSWYSYCYDACGVDPCGIVSELFELIPVLPDLDDDGALQAEFSSRYPTLYTKDTPTYLRAISAFGRELVAQLENLNRGSSLPLGLKTIWRQCRERGVAGKIHRFQSSVLARISHGETFSAADVRREVRSILNPERSPDVNA